MCLSFLNHTESYYGQSEQINFRLAVKPLSELYATLKGEEFDVVAFRACREWWLKDPRRSRQYVNRQMKQLIYVFKWSAGEVLSPLANREAPGNILQATSWKLW